MANQSITFTYQEEATSKNFNRLLYDLVPKGIVSGGELDFNEENGTIDNNSVKVSPMVCLFEDTLNKVMVKIELISDENEPNLIVSGVSTNANYIIGRYSWVSYKDNKMSFLAVNGANINPLTDIILGRVQIKEGRIASFSYIEKSWSTLHYEIPKKLNFLPLLDESNPFNLKIDCGEGYIDGYKVKNTNVSNTIRVVWGNYIDNQTICADIKGLITLARNSCSDSLRSDDSWNVWVCSHWNYACCGYPPLTTREMPIAYIKLNCGDTAIVGSCIDYIYNKSNQQNTTGLLTDYHYDESNHEYSVTVGGTTKTATAKCLFTSYAYDSTNYRYSITIGGTTKNVSTKNLLTNYSYDANQHVYCVTVGGNTCTASTTGLLTDYHYDASKHTYCVTVGGTTKTASTTGLLSDFSIKDGGQISISVGGTTKCITPKIKYSEGCGGTYTRIAKCFIDNMGQCRGIGIEMCVFFYCSGLYSNIETLGTLHIDVPSGTSCVCCYGTTIPEGYTPAGQLSCNTGNVCCVGYYLGV